MEKELKEFKSKLDLAVINAISNTEPKTRQETLFKLTYLQNINAILDNYEYLEPILSKHLNFRARENKFRGDER